MTEEWGLYGNIYIRCMENKIEISVSEDLKRFHSGEECHSCSDIVLKKGVIPMGSLHKYEPNPEIEKMFDEENKKWYKERMGI